MRGGALPGSENWFITEMTPGRDPVEELAVALMRVAVEPPDDLAAIAGDLRIMRIKWRMAQ